MDLLTPQQINQLIVLGVVLLVILFGLRLVFKLTMATLRLGCLIIFVIFIGVALLMVLR